MNNEITLSKILSSIIVFIFISGIAYLIGRIFNVEDVSDMLAFIYGYCVLGLLMIRK